LEWSEENFVITMTFITRKPTEGIYVMSLIRQRDIDNNTSAAVFGGHNRYVQASKGARSYRRLYYVIMWI